MTVHEADGLAAGSDTNMRSGAVLPTAAIPNDRSWAERIAYAAPWVILALPALYQIFLLSTAITGRIAYPYDLEWMEGGLLHHASRIHEGQGIYVPPSIDFIPYLYTPLYPSLMALFGGAFGLTYTLGRTISVLGLIGIFGSGLFSISNKRHEHVRRAPAIAGALLGLGLYSAAYPYMEGWYDLVRADTLCLFLVTSGIGGLPRWSTAAAGWRGHARIAAAAIMLALAFFTKQTGIVYVALGGLIVLAVNWQRLGTYVAAAGVIGLGGTALLQKTTDGWFWIYVRKIHATHDFNTDRFWKSFENILWHFPALTVVVAGTLVFVLVTRIVMFVKARKARREGREVDPRYARLPRATHPFLLWSATFAVSTLIGAIGWGTEFAHFNAYMPAFLHGGLAAGAAVPAVFACARLLAGEHKRWELIATGAALVAAIPLALACYGTRWNPNKFIPTTADVAAGDKLIERLRSIEGDVWMPSHPWYLHLAGKQPRVHRMGIKDVTWRQPRRVERLDDALRTHKFAAIVLDQRDVHLEVGGVAQHYRALMKLPPDERPKVYTGANVVPDSIWVPAVAAKPPAGGTTVFDFEHILWDGWTVSGSAWGPRPASGPQSGQGPALGATGRAYATSMHGGDAAIGRLTSPPFALDGSKLTLKLGGGSDATKLRVELWVGDKIVSTATVAPPGGETLQTVTLEIPERGAEGRLVFVDDSTTGHLTLDDVWLLR